MYPWTYVTTDENLSIACERIEWVSVGSSWISFVSIFRRRPWNNREYSDLVSFSIVICLVFFYHFKSLQITPRKNKWFASLISSIRIDMIQHATHGIWLIRFFYFLTVISFFFFVYFWMLFFSLWRSRETERREKKKTIINLKISKRRRAFRMKMLP